MEKRYRSRIDWVFYSTMVLMFLMTIGLPMLVYFDDEGGMLPAMIMFGIIVTIAALIISLPATTHYTFDKDSLICRSSFLKRTIPYSSITKIEQHKGLYAGWKFSLSSKGILIKYKKYDELYISPEDQDQFIQDLQEKNLAIKVV